MRYVKLGDLTVSRTAAGAEETERIADMDTGASLFFDHRDPAVVSQFATRHLDV
jgi:hypothetical protein